jgi:peptidase M16 inactive domain
LHKAIGTIYPPTREPKTLSDLQTIDLNALHSYYQEYLLSSEGLLCVITGDFDIETVKKQICPVIAMLKPQQASHREAPSTAVRKPVLLTAPSKESPQRASFNIVYPFTYEPHLGSVLSLKLLAEVIRDRVVSEVRERKGLIYSPYTTIELRPSPAHQAYIIVSGMADTKNVNEIKTTVDNIVQTLKNKPLTAEQLAPYKKRFMINKNESLTPDNSYAWRTYLTDRFKDGIPLEELEQYEEILLDNDCQHKEQH